MDINEERRRWDKLLAEEGMPPNLGEERLGKRVRIGLGVKSRGEEGREDRGRFHSRLCPIKLGVSVGGSDVDQPNDRPVEDAAETNV